MAIRARKPMSPDRRKAITSRATKKIRAVPKSLMRARQPMQKPQKRTVKIKFRRANRRSRVAAPVKIKAIFTNSEGWKPMGPMEIQFLAPKMREPSTTLKISSKQVSTATGQRRETVDFRSRSNRLRTRNTAMPAITQMVWVSSDLGE